MAMDGRSHIRPGAELCDVCGQVITDGSQVYALVPDSSAVHETASRFDGSRLLTGCDNAHLASLVREYEQRPYVAAELWAGQITRALQAASPASLTVAQLSAVTGLSATQIEAAVAWNNT
ncbi:hypothetical protein R8Z50_15075 [Longispora sp. K20-0274]|uniref:hypothetical protein n=1 Tax=Longispora sp. K20-0274 TaxID=3088255 RepID=UPI00399BEAF0